MKNNQFAIIVALLMLCCRVSVNAETFETLNLKDGSTVTGYIASQIPGASIRFEACEARIVVPDDFVRDTNLEDVELINLPTTWSNYIKNDPSILKENGGKQYLTFAKVNLLMPDDNSVMSVLRRKLFNQVRKEKVVPVKNGEKSVTYLDISHKTYTFDYSEISSIKSPIRPSDVSTGLEDIVRTRDGREYVGQIVLKTIGESIQVLQNNGEIVTISGKDIISYTKRKLDSEKKIEEQAQKLDYVYVGNMEYPGIIIYQDFGSEGQKPYLKLWENGGERRFEFEEIKCVERRENPYYKEEKIEVLTGNNVRFEGKRSQAVDCVKSKNGFVIAGDDVGSHVVLMENDLSNGLSVEMVAKPKNYQVALYPLILQKNGRYSFTLDNPVPYKQIPQKDSRLGILQTSFDVDSLGYYILFHPFDSEGNVVEIK